MKRDFQAFYTQKCRTEHSEVPFQDGNPSYFLFKKEGFRLGGALDFRCSGESRIALQLVDHPLSRYLPHLGTKDAIMELKNEGDQYGNEGKLRRSSRHSKYYHCHAAGFQSRNFLAKRKRPQLSIFRLFQIASSPTASRTASDGQNQYILKILKNSMENPCNP